MLVDSVVCCSINEVTGISVMSFNRSTTMRQIRILPDNSLSWPQTRTYPKPIRVARICLFVGPYDLNVGNTLAELWNIQKTNSIFFDPSR